ncbi:MAG: glycosyltransferase family 39 protein [Actinomycetota bacterium]|nr:glycosyltransferase family 39 protein [Actinomycetota bacterium]
MKISKARGLILAASSLTTVVALALGSRAHNRRPFTDETVYRLLARNLLEHDFYGYRPGRAIAYRAPGYPFFDTALRVIHDSNVTVWIAQAFLAGMTVWLAAWIARRLFGDVAAVAAAVLLAAGGTLAVYASFELSETLSTATLVAAVAVLIIAADRNSWRFGIGAGALLGASILARPQTLLLILPLGLVAAGAACFRDRRRWLVSLALIEGALIVLIPWTVRNYVRLHAFVPVSTYGGVNFFVANNPLADGVFRPASRSLGAEEYARISALPEVEQDHEYYRLGIEYIRHNPAKSLRNWARNGFLYVRRRDPLIDRYYHARRFAVPRFDDRFLWPFALAGFAVAMRGRRRWRAALPAIVIAYFVAFFMVFVPLARFRHGVAPFLAVYAGAAIGALVTRLRSARATEKSTQ